MKKTACIYTSNTGVGLVADVDLLQDLLFDYYDIDVVYFEHNINSTSSNNYVPREYDVGIYIQEFHPDSLPCNKKNIFFVNEEWLNSTNVKHIRDFDKVICKSAFSQQLLSPYNNNVVNSGFISRDKFDPNIQRKDTFLHLGGKSWQKGTEAVLNIFNKNELPLTFIQSNKNYDNSDKDKNITYINNFLDVSKLNKLFNTSSIHLCPSIYEGWGHYVYEALSVGALVYVTRLPMFLEWLDPELVVFNDCIYSGMNDDVLFLRKRKNTLHQFGWLVDEECLEDNINNYKKHLEYHNPTKVRDYFRHLNDKNSHTLLNHLLDL